MLNAQPQTGRMPGCTPKSSGKKVASSNEGLETGLYTPTDSTNKRLEHKATSYVTAKKYNKESIMSSTQGSFCALSCQILEQKIITAKYESWLQKHDNLATDYPSPNAVN